MKIERDAVAYEWDREELGTVTVEIGYSVSPVIPASMSGPEEGGGDIEYITAKAIKWYDEAGRLVDRTANIEELDEAERNFPPAMAHEIAAEHHANKINAAIERRMNP